MVGSGKILGLVLLLGLTSSVLLAQPNPFDGRNFKGRIAWSSDGNHNDEDDWAASPVALAIFNALGVNDQVVHFDYNSILNNNDPEWARIHEESVLGAVARFGYDRSRFHNCQGDLDAAINSLASAIDNSSTQDPLYLVIAGPMEVAYQAIQKSNPEKRKYVSVISHSRWNDGFDREYAYNYNKRNVIPTGIKWIQIRDQNRFLSNSPYGRHAKPEEWSPFHWMRDSSDDNIRFLWQRLRVSTRADCSDAGMAYFLMTGDEDSEIAKLRSLLEGWLIPAPKNPRTSVRIEAENFLALKNFLLEFKHKNRSVSHRIHVELEEGASTGRMQTPFEQPYTAAHGRYNVEVRYFDDAQGTSQYKFWSNGYQEGFSWLADEDDDAWKTKTISGVDIHAGDELMLSVERDKNELVRVDYLQLNYLGSSGNP